MFISAPPTRGGEASGLLTTGTGTAIAVLCVRGRARGVARTQVLTGCLASAMIRVVTYWRARGPAARIRSSKLEIRSEAASKPKPKPKPKAKAKDNDSDADDIMEVDEPKAPAKPRPKPKPVNASKSTADEEGPQKKKLKKSED